MMPPVLEEEVPTPRVAIIGRPNVGKSSLVNALLGEERVLVEPRPGTTVDAIDAKWPTAHGTFTLVDTAGIRRQAMFEDQAEFYATMRALQALERADIAILMVDSTRGFEKQEARLAHHALDAGCALLILYNKWDHIEEREAAWKAVQADRARRFPTLADIPAHPDLGHRAHPSDAHPRVRRRARRAEPARDPDARAQRVAGDRPEAQAGAEQLDGQVAEDLLHDPDGKRPPTFTLFVNAPSRLSDNYRRYLWSQFAEHFGFQGTPLRFRVRKSE
jgi:GTP-binding protein